MAAPRDADDPPVQPRGTKVLLRRALISGVAITIPLLVTLVIIGFVLNFISSTLDPVVGVVQGLTPNQEVQVILIEATTVLTLLIIVLFVGLLAEFGPGEGRLGEGFDEVMESIPGVGSVYTSFNEMSELLLDSDTDSFQEVKLVEYPRDGSYTVAFKTAQTPDVIGDATGHEEMVTLFMPMAPNPVMGGFVIHVSRDRVMDVDMTVEQGIRSIVTSGVAIGEEGPGMRGLTRSQMRELSQIERIDNQVVEGEADPELRDREADARRDEYDESVAPVHSETPEKIRRRTREEGTVGREMEAHERPDEVRSDDVIGETSADTPAERAGRDPDRVEETSEKTPAEMAGRAARRRAETESPPAAEADGGADDAGEEPGDSVDGSREAVDDSDAGESDTDADEGR